MHIVVINAIVAVVLADIITLKTKRERTAVTSIGAVAAVVHIVYKVAKIVKVAKAFAILQKTAILEVEITHSTYSKKAITNIVDILVVILNSANAATTVAMPMLILRKAVEVAIVAVRAAVINDRTKFAAIEHPRPGTKYRQTRTGNNK